jgi:2-polyprenyl-3-methyl-5-hydroxy-6-metoxy-1,4-benzoquinol methylase
MDKDRIKTFAEKVNQDAAGAMTAGMAYIGTKMGLFRAMAGKGPLDAASVAKLSGLQPRYVEEWLKGMTAAGYLDYDPSAVTFRLSDEHAYLLASEGTDHFMGGLFLMTPVLLGAAPRVAEAFRSGGGVTLDDLGPDGVDALDWLNCGQYEHRFTSHWLTAVPGVTERLAAGGRILDVGCGTGRVAIAMAKAFPAATVVGLDPNPVSISKAQAAATGENFAGRLRFVAQTTGSLDPQGGFDLITACDCIHDFAQPRETLSEIRNLLKPGGTLFALEPKAADRLEDNAHALGTVFYGFSIFHCMTQSLAHGGAGLGTCLGPVRTMELLREAGFDQVELIPIRSQTQLFYAARA